MTGGGGPTTGVTSGARDTVVVVEFIMVLSSFSYGIF